MTAEIIEFGSLKADDGNCSFCNQKVEKGKHIKPQGVTNVPCICLKCVTKCKALIEGVANESIS